MEPDAWQPFAELIERGDVEGMAAALGALDESARKHLSRSAKQARDQRAEEPWPDPGTERWQSRRDRQDAVEAAVFATSGPAAAARSWWVPWDHPGLRERLVRSRAREWRQDWAERVMADDNALVDWRGVHDMVRDGLIDRPAGIGYVSGAVTGFMEIDRGRLKRPLADVLREEPEWLARDLWRFFELEEAGLTSRDGSFGGGRSWWLDALCELAGEGTIDRGRLLDASLAALRRDFTAYNAGWYRKLHEALEPTLDEHGERLDDLLALLASEDTGAVGFALKALGRLERAGRLPAERLVDAAGPAMLVSTKGHAVRAVKLVGRVVERDPGIARQAAPALLDALAHESRDVQAAAVEVLELHRLDPGERERAAALSRQVDPALRGRLAALGGEAPEPDAPAVATGPRVALPGRRTILAGAPRLGDATPLRPVADVDELLDRAAVALEREEDPDEIELVLDGVSRLRGGRADAGRVAALLERAGAQSPIWKGHVGFNHARDALAAVLMRWLDPACGRVQLLPTGRSPREAIALRIRELLGELPAGEPRPLLATPTHAGGWIEAGEAVRRVAGLGGRPPVMDLAQMVLRLAPDGAEAARVAAQALKGEAASVLAHALGAEVKRPLLARLKPAWAAAGHARDPGGFALPPRDLDSWDDRRAEWFPTRKIESVDPASPADLLALQQTWWGWDASRIERWLATVWPANHEPVLHIAVRRLWLNDGSREYGIGEILGLLLDPAEPVGEQAALALALGLGCADVTDRALAVDVTIAALGDRRLDGAALGEQLAGLLREHAGVIPARWTATLGDVAAAGALCAHDVQIAVESVLGAAVAADRRRLLGLVELLRLLAVEGDAAVASPAARAWLESLSPGSKGGRAAREALAVTGDGAGRSRRAAAEVAP